MSVLALLMLLLLGCLVDLTTLLRERVEGSH